MKLKRFIFPIIIIICVFWIFYFVLYPRFKNEETIIVPDIIGYTKEEGEEELKKYNIKYKIVYKNSDIDDIVINTNPTKNTLIKESQTVEVTVSQKTKEKIMDFVGLTKNDAIEVLEKYKNEYKISYDITYEYNNQYDRDTVLKQNISSGNLDEIVYIHLTVSKQNITVDMLDFVGKGIEEAINFCNDKGFVIKTVFINSLFESGIIVYQDIQPNTTLYINSKDEIWFYVSK